MSETKNLKRWTRKENGALRRLLKEGKTAKQIGTELGRSPFAIATHKHELGIKRSRRTYKKYAKKSPVSRNIQTPVVAKVTKTPRAQRIVNPNTPVGLTLSGGTFNQHKLNMIFKAAKENNTPVSIKFD